MGIILLGGNHPFPQRPQAKLIVCLTLLIIAEHFICFGCFLNLSSSVLSPGFLSG
jgi:hypothetical protein